MEELTPAQRKEALAAWRRERWGKFRWTDITFTPQEEDAIRIAALEADQLLCPSLNLTEAVPETVQKFRAICQRDLYKRMAQQDLTPNETEERLALEAYLHELQKLARRRELANQYQLQQQQAAARPAPRLYGAEEVRARVLAQAAQFAPRLQRRGGQLVLDEWNEVEFDALCLYFARDHAFERLGAGYHLDKYLLLRGPVGVGKSTMLQIFCQAQLQQAHGAYRQGHCKKVSAAYTASGHKGLEPYYRGAWFLDDLGTEDIETHHFGTYLRPMAEVITTRYDDGVRLPMHFTTNCSDETLLANYDVRAFDRLQEEYNLIDFQTDAPSRRIASE